MKVNTSRTVSFVYFNRDLILHLFIAVRKVLQKKIPQSRQVTIAIIQILNIPYREGHCWIKKSSFYNRTSSK